LRLTPHLFRGAMFTVVEVVNRVPARPPERRA
jgi:hypothetical protein